MNRRNFIVSTAAIAAAATAAADDRDYAAAYALVQSGECDTLVVVLGASWCQPCHATWAEARRISRPGVAVVYLDADSRQGRTFRSGASIPQVIVMRRTLGVWHRQRLVGRRSRAQIEAAIEATKRAADKTSWWYRENGAEQFGETLRRHLIDAHGIRADLLVGIDDETLDNIHGYAHEGLLGREWHEQRSAVFVRGRLPDAC